jgi:hypothetical protein
MRSAIEQRSERSRVAGRHPQKETLVDLPNSVVLIAKELPGGM